MLGGDRLYTAKKVSLRKFRRRYIHCSKNLSDEWKDRMLKIMRKTGTTCSCWMCGNPRKYFKQKHRNERLYKE